MGCVMCPGISPIRVRIRANSEVPIRIIGTENTNLRRFMKAFVISALLVLLLSDTLQGQTKSLLIEDMTWTEVHDAIATGKTTAI